MAALTRCLLAAMFGMLAAGAVAGDAQEVSVAQRAFAEVPYPPSVFIWWRPYRTVVPSDIEMRLRARLDEIQLEAGEKAIPQQVVPSNIESAFAFPVLATDGARGARLLDGVLSQYADGRSRDNQWLLTIFALACNDSDPAVKSLRLELVRVKANVDQSGGTMNADLRLPVIDALAIASARRRTLTFKELQDLANVIPERSTAILLLGLHYANTWMRQDQVVQLMRDGLQSVQAGTIQESLKSGVQTHPVLTSFRNFLISSPDVWGLAPRLLEAAPTAGDEVRDFLLVANLLVMTYQADATLGTYKLDANLIEQFRAAKLTGYPQASLTARILETCEPSLLSAAWKRYISQLASEIRPEDIEMADYLAARTREQTKEKEQLYGLGEPAATPEPPGIYLYGITRAGGMMPGASRD